MKIAICGAGKDISDGILEKSYTLGKEVAKKGHTILTGAGTGYPLEAAKGAISSGGEAIGVSPANDSEEHIKKYGFSKGSFSDIIYTGEGIPRRNFSLVEMSDAVIIIGGQIGTLNEFTIAHHMNKVIGVLLGSGGITSLIKEITKVCDKKNESEKIVYSDDPKELVEKLLSIS